MNSNGLAAFLEVSTVKESKIWLMEYARAADVDYGILMRTVDYLLEYPEVMSDYKKFWRSLVLTKEFWRHYQVVTNCHLMDEDKWEFLPYYFRGELQRVPRFWAEIRGRKSGSNER